MMQTYEITPPPKIVFGRGVRFQLSGLQAGTAIVCGRHYAESAEPEKILGRKPDVLFVLPPGEPELKTIDELREKAVNCKAVIAVGGGSVMDAAKAAATLLRAPSSTAEYFYGRATPPAREVFLAAIPTTAGTGAEMTGNAVLTDSETGIKQSLRAPNMKPDISLNDPELLYHAPTHVLAASGLDALTQALESLVSRKANAYTTAMAAKASELLLNHLEAACAHDHEALSLVAEASMLTGIAFAASGLGAVHGVAHPLGSIRHIPHGTACALLLPHVLEINREAYRAIGMDAPALRNRVEELKKKLNLPATAEQYGLTRADFPFIVSNCRSGSMKCNPVELSDADVTALLEELL